MPQLAPVNWLLLFFIFWFIVALMATLIWWTSKTEYTISKTNAAEDQSPLIATSKSHTKSWWDW